jgi:hypothetical protein
MWWEVVGVLGADDDCRFLSFVGCGFYTALVRFLVLGIVALLCSIVVDAWLFPFLRMQKEEEKNHHTNQDKNLA